jgi:hypothetical protein
MLPQEAKTDCKTFRTHALMGTLCRVRRSVPGSVSAGSGGNHGVVYEVPKVPLPDGIYIYVRAFADKNR